MLRNAHSFEEFDLDAALTISNNNQRKSIKLAGVGNIRSIYNNPSTSTEEFVIGAVEALGKANRNLMYANMSIEGFAHRFQVATRVAKNINIAHDRGLEGFERVHPMNPLAYSLENGDKPNGFKDFVGRIWESLQTAVRNILTSIANFIKYIVNKIREIGLKKAVKDKEEFDKLWSSATNMKRFMLKETINSYKLQSLNWKEGVCDKFKEVIDEIVNQYNGVFPKSDSDDYKMLTDTSKFDAFVSKNEEEKANSGIDTEKIKTAIEKIDSLVKNKGKGLLSKFLTDTDDKTSHRKAMASIFYSGDKPIEMTVEVLMKNTNNFSCLNADWFKKEITGTIATANAAQKNLTAYAKAIDNFISKYKKAAKDIDNNDEFKKWAMQIGRLSLKRMAVNSYMQSLLMEVEINAFRLSSTCHKAIRKILKSNKKAGESGDKQAETNESLKYGIDSIFKDL